jgi:hypothetical protein
MAERFPMSMQPSRRLPRGPDEKVKVSDAEYRAWLDKETLSCDSDLLIAARLWLAIQRKG